MLALTGLAVATLGAAAFVGWVDLHNTDVQASVMAVAIASFAIAALFANGGWCGGVLVGLGVPLAHLYADIAGYQLPYPFPHPMSSFLALVPALAGAITGLALRAGIAQARA
ncbi:MAG TPA: hypothetical protein VIJ16_04495 [Gemmatimonadaceae bacterium]